MFAPHPISGPLHARIFGLLLLTHCLEHPSHGAQRVGDELMLKGVQVSSGGVRGVWGRHGEGSDIVIRMNSGEIRPSKSLAEGLAGLMEGNREFTMIDEQKVVFERALHLVRTTPPGEKRILIVHGRPRTGRSVVAVNLLAELIQDRVLAQYVTKNAAPRAVYEVRLTGVMSKYRQSCSSRTMRADSPAVTAQV